jgi:hypothetical protein
VSTHRMPKRSLPASSLPRGRLTTCLRTQSATCQRSHVSECFEQIHRAIQSYDDNDLRSFVARLADAARRNQQTVERVIVDLKSAVNSLPASSLRDRVRRELRDSVVRVAIRAYYDGMDSLTTRLAWQ